MSAVILNTVLFAAFFSVYNVSPFRTGVCLLVFTVTLLSLYVQLVEHCYDLRINCSEFIFTQFLFCLVQCSCEQVTRTAKKHFWLVHVLTFQYRFHSRTARVKQRNPVPKKKKRKREERGGQGREGERRRGEEERKGKEKQKGKK